MILLQLSNSLRLNIYWSILNILNIYSNSILLLIRLRLLNNISLNCLNLWNRTNCINWLKLLLSLNWYLLHLPNHLLSRFILLNLDRWRSDYLKRLSSLINLKWNMRSYLNWLWALFNCIWIKLRRIFNRNRLIDYLFSFKI